VITLDDPCGMPATIVGIKEHLGAVNILQQLNICSTTIKTARDEISRPFAFRVRVTRTQVDGYQCGPHTTANIVLFAGNLDDKRACGVVAQDMRLWMAYMLWLHGDVAIKLPSLNTQQSALHERFEKNRHYTNTSYPHTRILLMTCLEIRICLHSFSWNCFQRVAFRTRLVG